jgi:soluble lytic murein transglycosylase-like protein
MKYKIEPSLVSALIKVESNWDHKAVSQRGAKGLMQLMPMRYLRYLLDKFDGDIALALAAYNAGPGKIQKYKGMPPILETKQYVERILSIYNNKKISL